MAAQHDSARDRRETGTPFDASISLCLAVSWAIYAEQIHQGERSSRYRRGELVSVGDRYFFPLGERAHLKCPRVTRNGHRLRAFTEKGFLQEESATRGDLVTREDE